MMVANLGLINCDGNHCLNQDIVYEAPNHCSPQPQLGKIYINYKKYYILENMYLIWMTVSVFTWMFQNMKEPLYGFCTKLRNVKVYQPFEGSKYVPMYQFGKICIDYEKILLENILYMNDCFDNMEEPL